MTFAPGAWRKGPEPPMLRRSPRTPAVLDGDCVHHERITRESTAEGTRAVGRCQKCQRVKVYARLVEEGTRWGDMTVGNGLPLRRRVPDEEESYD